MKAYVDINSMQPLMTNSNNTKQITITKAIIQFYFPVNLEKKDSAMNPIAKLCAIATCPNIRTCWRL